MDNHDHENGERRNSNTEYLPTKCRITRPPPPKPATNPLQFIKVAPCPLFQKAHEQIKKVEEIKKERKEIRDESEDWQQNLDNWKSSRRKRQEHIIERVVEVKKLSELDEMEKSTRKSKTFSEMLENRSRGRHKFTIPIYDDDSNDLSDYGIGSSSSKTNSVKDADTDDSGSVLDDKDQSFDVRSNKDNSSASNQSQSEDETNNFNHKKDNARTNINNNNNNDVTTKYTSTYEASLSSEMTPTKPKILPKPRTKLEPKAFPETASKEPTEQYTYEGAIQDYRSRITSKIKVDESIFTKNKDVSKSKEFSEAQTVLPKGEISKRKGLFEPEKLDINHLDSLATRRLSEDFANARSIKDRLRSLEKHADQSAKPFDKSNIQVSVKERLQSFAADKNDNRNNSKVPPSKISNYLLDKSSSTPAFENKKPAPNQTQERCYSPEAEMYMNKLNIFNRDLDNLMNVKSAEYGNGSNYAPSVSSVELAGLSSDREDSGIHTADVSCSVSQADEPIDTDSETASNTIPSCIKKLESREQEGGAIKEESVADEGLSDEVSELTSAENSPVSETRKEGETLRYTKEELINFTRDFLEDLIRNAAENVSSQKQRETELPQSNRRQQPQPPPPVQKTAIYENVQLKPYPLTPSVELIPNDVILDGSFSLSSPKLEPPKVKPPPPPPPEEIGSPLPMKRLNSTKRIKKEIHIKRNSFLGLDDQNLDLIDPDVVIEKPPDISSFLQKESKLEKSLYKKIQEESRGGMLSKVESQDSGLDIERGRLSSDTWCSSIGDSSTPSHERQDSEQTNSITSEEDEITKKEREIIEMVEKEEQSRDNVKYVNRGDIKVNYPVRKESAAFEPTLGSEQFAKPFLSQPATDFQDSEVLRVEHELMQLEKEELERQRENMLFRESRAKARLQNNRHSLENICDEIYPCYANTDCRKSMPELQHVPMDYRKSVPDVPAAYNAYDLDLLGYRKSMPDIQNVYRGPTADKTPQDKDPRLDHRKSMPELQQHDAPRRSAFKSPPPISRQPISPGKPIRSAKEFKPSNQQNGSVKPKQLSKHSLQALSAVPRPRHVPNDVWFQPKSKTEAKNYNQHWVFQEAELRRIADQQNNAANRSWHQRQEKPLPDSVIQTITQRVQNRSGANERNLPVRRLEPGQNRQYPYLDHQQTVGHALPTMNFAPPTEEANQDKVLSVSGKKKCSYCSNELGRGAAMIIESLCLFYHMECFKCCVCHVQLGDGRMGTDVRVRNQKLHCHNCYSSDDGVKFSCV